MSPQELNDYLTPKRNGKKVQLPPDFTPGNFSVLCGRGSKCTKSPGNIRLKKLILSYLKPYSQSKNKIEKSEIVSKIMSAIRETAPNGAFVKLEEGYWYEVEDAFAREKIGCMFRDALHTQYRSSTKAKLARKKRSQIPDNTFCLMMSGSPHQSLSVGQDVFAHHQLNNFQPNYQPSGALNMTIAELYEKKRMSDNVCSVSDNGCSVSDNVCSFPLATMNNNHSMPKRHSRGQHSFSNNITNPMSLPNSVYCNKNMPGSHLLELACGLVQDGSAMEDFPDDLADIFD